MKNIGLILLVITSLSISYLIGVEIWKKIFDYPEIEQDDDYKTYSEPSLDDVEILNKEEIDSVKKTSYEKDIPVRYVVSEDGPLNLRTSFSTQSEIIAKIPPGYAVFIVRNGPEGYINQNSNRWYLVKYKDKEGWVWGSYLAAK